jgi:hypothetical protein
MEKTMKSINKLLILGLTAVSLSCSFSEHAPSILTDQESWCHIEFKTAESIEVKLDYRVEFSNGFVASPVWVNVLAPQLESSDRIQATITTIRNSDNQAIQVHSESLSPVPDELRFTASFPRIVLAQDRQANTFGRHEMLLIRNGEKLKDQSGATNFRFNMSETHQSNHCF